MRSHWCSTYFILFIQNKCSTLSNVVTMLSVTTIINYEVNHYINIFIFMSLYLQMRCIVVYVSGNNELQAWGSAGFALLHFVFKMFLEMKMFWDWQPGRGARREMTRLYEYSDSDWHFSKDRLWSTKHKTSNTRGLFRIIHHVRLRISFLSGSHYHVLATLQCNKYISNLVAPWIGWVRYDKSLLI